MGNIETISLFNLDETIAKHYLKKTTYPWEALPNIKDYILEIGSRLDLEKFDKKGENIWIAKSANVADTAMIMGPAIIDEEAEIRHCAFLRQNVIVGKKAVVGNSTELKNCILFNGAQVPHFNYVGDSILGYKAHLGAGVITPNLKLDRKNIIIRYNMQEYITDLRKIGAMVGDFTEVGCNAVFNPGTIVCKNVTIYPLSNVRGVVEENSIYKNKNEIIEKKQ